MKKICLKILGENPDGDSKKLIAQLQAIKAYPGSHDGKVKYVGNPVICPAKSSQKESSGDKEGTGGY